MRGTLIEGTTRLLLAHLNVQTQYSDKFTTSAPAEWCVLKFPE